MESEAGVYLASADDVAVELCVLTEVKNLSCSKGIRVARDPDGLQGGGDDGTDGFVAVEVVVDFAAGFDPAFQRLLADLAQRLQVAVRVTHDQAGAVQLFQPSAGARVFADGQKAERAGPEGTVGVRELHRLGGELPAFRTKPDLKTG